MYLLSHLQASKKDNNWDSGLQVSAGIDLVMTRGRVFCLSTDVGVITKFANSVNFVMQKLKLGSKFDADAVQKRVCDLALNTLRTTCLSVPVFVA